MKLFTLNPLELIPDCIIPLHGTERVSGMTPGVYKYYILPHEQNLEGCHY